MKSRDKFPFWILVFIFLSAILCMVPMPVRAYFGQNEDYLLRVEKPKDRGQGHYLEFVSGDERIYMVQAGDTLWGIARKYYGSGLGYKKLWENNEDLVETPETLQIGTRLKVSECLYLGAGMEDYVDSNVLRDRLLTGSDPWEGDLFYYQIFESVPYRNDLGKQIPMMTGRPFRRR